MNAWCAARNEPRGELLTLEQTWALAQAWYHNRMDPDFRGRTVAEAIAIFENLNLKSAFWRP